MPKLPEPILRRYFPAEASKLTFEDAKAEAAIYFNKHNQVCAVGYAGRRNKPDFYYRFESEEAAMQYIQNWVSGLLDCEKRKQQAAEERKAVEHTMHVGDLLYASWGYDQTNIDFFQVVDIVSKKTVKIREIESFVTESSTLYGCYNKPVVDTFVGEPMSRRVSASGWINVDKVRFAHKYEDNGRGLLSTSTA